MRLVFMGSPDFATSALRALHREHEVVLVVTQPDKRAGRGRKMKPPAVKLVAEELGLPIVQPTSGRDPDFAALMRDAGAEIGVVVAYGVILPPAILEAFPRGCLNIHGSVLPQWRGAAPIQRAIMSGQSTTGVSIMQLDPGMDTGPVFESAEIAIADDDTTGTLARKLAPLGAELLLRVLADIGEGKAVPRSQDDIQATHAAMLRKEDGRVDWDRPAPLVSAQIRGVDPWPGAYSFVSGSRVKLFGAVARDGSGESGGVLALEPLTIACGQGAVVIEEAQAAGKKRMGAATFARGAGLDTTSRFGCD